MIDSESIRQARSAQTRGCVVFGTDFSGVAGGELTMLEIGIGLRSLGWSPILIAQPGALCETARASDIPVWELPARPRASTLDACFAEIAPDILHLVSYGSLTRELSRVARRRDIPVVLTVSAVGFPSGFRSRRFVRTARTVLVPSNRVLTEVRSRVRMQNVIVLPHMGLGSGDHKPSRTPFENREADRVNVGWIGRLDPVKRLEDTVAAFAALSEVVPGARLRIAAGRQSFGDVSADQYREQICDLIRSLGIVAQTELAEDVADVYGFLNDIDVVLQSSERETFSRSTFEAMIMGRAIVSTHSGAVAELIRDGRNGILVNDGDVGGLAQGLITLTGEREYAARLGAAAREDALRMVARYAPVQRTDDIYTSLLKRQSR